jgi:hypothetical protein
MAVGMILGGTLIMSLSAGSSFFVEKQKPSPKALVRDFIVGSVLVALIMQLLPESSETVLTGLFSLIPASVALPALPSLPSMGSSTSTDDMEVEVGVPKF